MKATTKAGGVFSKAGGKNAAPTGVNADHQLKLQSGQPLRGSAPHHPLAASHRSPKGGILTRQNTCFVSVNKPSITEKFFVPSGWPPWGTGAKQRGGGAEHFRAAADRFALAPSFQLVFRIISLALIALAFLFALAGCRTHHQNSPALVVVGDCEGYSLTANTSLEDAVALAKPRAEQFDVLLIGSDGMISRISGDELDGCVLVYSSENAWEVKSELHPPSARVKNLALVAVMSVSEDTEAFLRLLKKEGASAKNGRSVTVYTTRMITAVSDDALRFLEQGERVMIIELDGLGWKMLEMADAPYLKSLQPQEALVCYPPISPVGLASMLTGATPDIHGIHDRENRQMACEDLFAKAQEMGKTCAYVEGSHALLNTSIRPVLSLNDEEVLANAQMALESEPDLIFVHFHEIDEAAHKSGPPASFPFPTLEKLTKSILTHEKIKEIDGYVRVLVEGYDGRVIITADHGMHETEEGGDHGQFLAEDMIVPYIIK